MPSVRKSFVQKDMCSTDQLIEKKNINYTWKEINSVAPVRDDKTYILFFCYTLVFVYNILYLMYTAV